MSVDEQSLEPDPSRRRAARLAGRETLSSGQVEGTSAGSLSTGDTTSYKPRDHSFGALALMLRERAGLTQQELAAMAGVSERAIQKWEAGESYPSAQSLKRLIGAYVQRGVFAAGREAEEAESLWDAVPKRRLKETFDHAWFAALVPQASADVGPGATESASAAGQRATSTDTWLAQHVDWGEAPDISSFYGRRDELDTLTEWVISQRCRAVAILGLGGIGKTSAVTKLVHNIAPHFACIFWRSLANALPFDEWLTAAIYFLSAQQHTVLPAGQDARLLVLLDLLKKQRCLLVLDNWETVHRARDLVAGYREGCEGYGVLLKRLGEAAHQSCLLITSREQPAELGPLASLSGPVRTYRLRGLDEGEVRTILQGKELSGDDTAWRALVARLGGNALALRLMGETIGALFGGDITVFLAEPEAIFGDLRQLLDSQWDRLSPLENTLLYWLTVAREPVTVGGLATDLGTALQRADVYEGLEALLRRSLIDAGERTRTFTLQPTVLEYMTDRLIEEVSGEIQSGRAALLVSHALMKATAKDYVRRSQERLIAAPVLERLVAVYGSAEEAAQRLLNFLEVWRGCPAATQGYGPGNVVNLLRLLRGNLCGLNLSHLHIRQAYLQEVEAQDLSLAGAHLTQSVLAEAFHNVFSVAFSTDGSYLAAGTADSEVRLWRVADRTPIRSVQGQSGLVYGLALSADGRVLASGGHDGTVKLWDMAPGSPDQLLHVLHAHSGQVIGMALSADGRLVASGAYDGMVRLWDVESGQCLATMHAHPGGAYAVALSASGHLAASSGNDGIVRVWDTASWVPSTALLRGSVHASESPGYPVATMAGHTGGIWGLALSADGRLVASGGLDGMIMLWEAASGRRLLTLQGHTGQIYSMALNTDGRLLASGGLDGMVKLWEVPSGQILATLQAHTGGVFGVAVSGSGQLVASGGLDGTVKLWEAETGRLLATLQGHSGIVYAVARSGDGRLVAGCGDDGAIRVWDTTTGRALATLRGHSGIVYGIAMSADGHVVVSGGGDGMIRLWETAHGRCLTTLPGHMGWVRGVAMSEDGDLAASCGQDGTVRIWETALEGGSPGRQLAVLPGHSGLVFTVALSADGRLVASGGYDRTVRVWEAASGRPLATLQENGGLVFAVALSADGRLVASAGEDALVRLWETGSGRCVSVLKGHAATVFALAMSRDGRLLASSGVDGTIKVWDTHAGTCLASLQSDSGIIYSMAMGAGGQQIVSGGDDGVIRLWDVQAGVCLFRLRPDRRYERMDITGLTGVTSVQHAALQALGATETEP
jgi:WD40 repeat protein/transcriptional regulator with XRE-family HTH domain